ncbi:MAG: hypothetical protein V3W34_05305 [Phycisphaerae bacterium]
MNGLLSASRIKDLSLDPEQKDAWIKAFECHEFDRLPEGKGLGITPFFSSNLGAVSYDLTVGDQVYLLRRGEKLPLSAGGESLKIDPGETALVLTREFIALGPQLAGITMSRARVMNEGIALSSAKIDPTWYGCLVIPITNNSRRHFKLRHGDRFCTLLVFQLENPVEQDKYLTKEKTPHLGQSTFDYEPTHTIPWEPMRPDTVREEDMDKAVAFGPPFDVIRGMFELNHRRIVKYMEEQWGPNAMRLIKHSAWEEEFQQIKEYRQTEVSLLEKQIQILEQQGEAARSDRKNQSRLVFVMILAVFGWIALVVKLLIGSGVGSSGG